MYSMSSSKYDKNVNQYQNIKLAPRKHKSDYYNDS